MVIKGQVEIPNETKTGFNVLHGETSADMVLYDDTTVADVLEEHQTKIAGISSIYAKKSEVSSFMRYKGSVENSAALPTDTSVLSIGDVYNVSVGGGTDEDGLAIKSGDNVAWAGTGWDNLGSAVDLGSVLKIYVGNVQPTDTSVIWLDTSAYE